MLLVFHLEKPCGSQCIGKELSSIQPRLKAIQAMEPPTTFKLLKTYREGAFGWAPRAFPLVVEEECAIPAGRGATSGFPRIKSVLSLSLTMISVVKDLLLILYLTSTNKFMVVLLAKEVKGVKYLVYCLSRSLKGANLNNTTSELYLSLRNFAIIFQHTILTWSRIYPSQILVVLTCHVMMYSSIATAVKWIWYYSCSYKEVLKTSTVWTVDISFWRAWAFEQRYS